MSKEKDKDKEEDFEMKLQYEKRYRAKLYGNMQWKMQNIHHVILKFIWKYVMEDAKYEYTMSL